jgi:hypothetical protein
MKKIILCIVGAWACCSAARAAEPVSLAGDWRFRIDEQKVGATEKWFGGALAGETKIKLPGTMDDAGLGPKNTKPPTLEGPYRLYDYAGPAWYQRDIDIPAAWQGQRVTLFLERCRWVTAVWLDDRLIGTQDSLIAPHVYELGMVPDEHGRDGARPSSADVAPGKHRLTICVDNTVKINLGKFVSALFGGTWGNMNGIIGRIELAATPPVWIEELQAYPQLAKQSVLIKGKLGNATGLAGSGELQWNIEQRTSNNEHRTKTGKSSVTWTVAGGVIACDIPLGADAKFWDEFSPSLVDLTLTLDARPSASDTRHLRFGLREFAAQGTQFTLNGRPVYLRGTLECSVFPLTGYPPTDVAPWHRIFRIMKSYGLNHIRFHSWCPPEAAFAAADEDGIMIQAEGPMANVEAGADPIRDAFIEAEFKRIVDTYGNHPSFCTMTLGNEYGGKDELLTGWVAMLQQRDPRHLYSSASSAQKTVNRQWTELATGRGIPGAGTERDLRAIVASDARPIIGHEIGQWMYFPDFNEIKKWSGVMALKNFEMIRDDLEQKHLLELAPQYVAASGPFATLLYKEEIEVLLRTPGYAGFSLLDLHDYPTQGTALIGPLDPFWDSKGFITPAAYRRFCGPTVPLLRMPKRTYTADEPFVATADLAHYGPADLEHAQPVWKITDAQGREIAAGALPALKAPTGKLTELGAISASLAKATAPAKLKVTVALQGTDISNDWDIWVYPADLAPQPPADVVVCEKWDAAQAALAAGKKVVLFASAGGLTQSLRGKFLPVFWSPVWFPSQKPNTMGLLCDPRQPLLAQFPTEMHSNWQWYELLQRSRLFILDDTPAAYRPLVQVIDNFARNHKLGLVFEGRAGTGRLLVCGIDLPALPKDPAARQLLASLYAYAGSAAFAPHQELEAGLLEGLFVPKYANKLQELGAKVRADSEDRGHDHLAEYVLDGDPATFWHTAWGAKNAPMPHNLVVDMGREISLKGLTYLPRQDQSNGRIATAEIFCSNNPKVWGAPVAKVTWPNTADRQTVLFPQPVKARYLKLVACSEVRGQAFAGAAELDIIPGE